MTPEELKRLIETGNLTKTQVSALVDQAQGEYWDNASFDAIGSDSFMKGYDSYDALRGLGTDKSATPWYQDSAMLGSIAGLGSTLAQLAAVPSQIDYANTQSKALKQNIATAKEEQARRNKNISAFNSFKG